MSDSRRFGGRPRGRLADMALTLSEAHRRVDEADWPTLAGELDVYGCALTPPLLSPAECRDLAALYDRPELFRSSVDMARHRFGSGEYRYFTHDLPAPVAALRAALYPGCCPSRGTGPSGSAALRPGPTPFRSGWTGAMRPARTARRRSCCATARATGTPSTGTCSVTWSSRSRW